VNVLREKRASGALALRAAGFNAGICLGKFMVYYEQTARVSWKSELEDGGRRIAKHLGFQSTARFAGDGQAGRVRGAVFTTTEFVLRMRARPRTCEGPLSAILHWPRKWD
jgi:hypothetical protein